MTGLAAHRQAAALADPDRVQLLSLILSDPRGQIGAASLVATGPTTPVQAHLDVLCQAGLLELVSEPGGLVYRPTHDALARFATLLGTPQSTSAPPRPDRLIERITDQIAAQFAGVLSAQTVAQFVDDSYTLLASRASVQTYLPVLTARFAADRLEALAKSTLRAPATDVLFVCVANSGRSQLAAAALRTRAGQAARVRTAGSAPGDRVDPAVWRVIERRGWVSVLEFPKPLTQEVVAASDVVVTMGCGEACPVLPGRTYLDWQVPDPAGQPVAAVERIADEVEAHVADLFARLQLPIRTLRR